MQLGDIVSRRFATPCAVSQAPALEYRAVMVNANSVASVTGRRGKQ